MEDLSGQNELISSQFNLQTRLAVIDFLIWHRKGLIQDISDLNHVIEYLKIGDGVECEKKTFRQMVAGVIIGKLAGWV